MDVLQIREKINLYPYTRRGNSKYIFFKFQCYYYSKRCYLHVIIPNFIYCAECL